MQRFRNLLVGVDLSDAIRIVGQQLPRPTREAIDRAVWLAKLNSAQVTFMTVLPTMFNLSKETRQLIEQAHLERVADDVLQAANEALSSLVSAARDEGVQARSKLTFGRSWLGLIQQVMTDQHDLVIVGSRNLHGLQRLVIGSTGMKLLRKCPCPVWITTPQDELMLSSILVATDFTPVSRLATDLAASLARIHGSQLHVLHAVEYSWNKKFWLKQVPGEFLNEYLRKSYAQARQRLDEELARPELVDLPLKPIAHLQSDCPEEAILKAVEFEKVKLLVMGTVGRGGIPGLLVGNTAEHVLTEAPCSVLTVKPHDFVCPVALEPKQEVDP